MQEDGTIIWSSTGDCTSAEIMELIVIAARRGRYMHLNTSAHGNKQGFLVDFESQSKLSKDEFFNELEDYANRDQKLYWVS